MHKSLKVETMVALKERMVSMPAAQPCRERSIQRRRTQSSRLQQLLAWRSASRAASGRRRANAPAPLLRWLRAARDGQRARRAGRTLSRDRCTPAIQGPR